MKINHMNILLSSYHVFENFSTKKKIKTQIINLSTLCDVMID